MRIDPTSNEASELINRALRRGVRKALFQHKRLGNPIAIDVDGKVEIVQPESIVIPEFDDKTNDSQLVNRMTNDYTVNASIAYDLNDARDEIDSILELFAPNEKVDETEFRVRMAHLYFHINCAWNKRDLSDAELESADGKALTRLAQFPLDITPN